MAFAPKHERQKDQHTLTQRESVDFARSMRLTQKKKHDTRLLEIAIGRRRPNGYGSLWAYYYYMNQRHANVDDNDVRQAVATASAIDDDRLWQATGGTVVPDSFTHGTSQQRVQWLTTGLRSRRIKDCDTFKM
jgi:ABC-type oligopeptide transport system substrate-binding subunit